jgi:choline dehydrogenase-like flavoprotein
MDADVCIAGGGPAGIALARRLAGRGARVVLLESGGLEFDSETQALYEGEVAGADYWALATTRLRFFGGSSNHWTGWCRPLDALDFEERSWVAESGWPISREELEPYYEEAQGVCELGPFDYRPSTWAERTGTRLLPLDPELAETTIWQFSPPTRFGTRYRSQLQAAPDVHVYLNANLVHVGLSPRATSVEMVRVARLDGTQFFVRARAFVLALGGIEIPRVLLASNDVQPSGIGNQHDLVGRFFLEHPHSIVGTLVCRSEPEALRLYEAVSEIPGGGPAAVRASLSLPASVQRRERLLNFNVNLEPLVGPAARARNAAAAATLLRELHGIEARASFELLARAEQLPSPASRVRLGTKRDRLGMPHAVLEWRHHARTRHSMQKSLELIARALGMAGLGRVYSYIHADARSAGAWPELAGGHHHMGTTRMHTDPRHGVVDADCRVHGIDNLFIAGSSVFPSAGYANPTLTLVALALRTADRVQELL